METAAVTKAYLLKSRTYFYMDRRSDAAMDLNQVWQLWAWLAKKTSILLIDSVRLCGGVHSGLGILPDGIKGGASCKLCCGSSGVSCLRHRFTTNWAGWSMKRKVKSMRVDSQSKENQTRKNASQLPKKLNAMPMQLCFFFEPKCRRTTHIKQ